MTFPAGSRRYAHWWLDRCFLYAGRMTEAKGVPQVLRAWMRLAEGLGTDCPPLWLAGGGPREIEGIRHSVDLAALAAHEAAGRIRWWGYLDAPGISTLLLKAYVLVTHSLYEPGGRVILEAMTQGIPVIATPHGFAADLIRDWHGGFLVDYGDEEALRRRMEHFALQPLLRHAMGRAAWQAASEDLKRRDFMGTHLRVYGLAARRRPGALTGAAAPDRVSAARVPAPRGFGGVYPFEGEAVGESEAAAFLARQAGEAGVELIERPTASGRARLWETSGGRRRWIVKQAFSTYKRRPMWDRGYGGRAVELQRVRVAAEILAAHCRGSAQLKDADAELGLTLREWLEPARFGEPMLPACARLLSSFHASRHPSIDLEWIRARLDRDWRAVSDQKVSEELIALEADFQSEGRPWHAWRPMSVRLGWRWLELGLRHRWLSLPDGLGRGVDVWIDEESAVAARGEGAVSFGLCHGDSDPEHLRIDRRGRMVLIDCERLHPGYFGHDWAGLVLRALNDAPDDASAAATLKVASEGVESALCPPWLLLSWLKLITVMRLCRAHVLMEKDALVYGLARLRRVRKLTGDIRRLCVYD